MLFYILNFILNMNISAVFEDVQSPSELGENIGL